MKICLAQVQSEKGEVERNVGRHVAVLRQLRPGSADLVAFPELSLSNYDPDIAEASAVRADDDRLAGFQRFADETGIAVAVGAPLKSAEGPVIALLVFRSNRAPSIVGKRHLHQSEVPYFSPAGEDPSVLDFAVRVGVAICYEISVAEHASALVSAGAEVYLASVAKTPGGADKARIMLSETARRHGIPALLVNSVGTCEGKPSGGGSMVIDREGRLVRQLGGSEEGLLVYDTDTEAAIALPMGR